MLRTGFFRYAKTPSQFAADKRASQLLTSLWQPTQEGASAVNSPKSLPAPLNPKQQTFAEVAEANPDASPMILKVKQFFAFGKSILKFYKSGIVNVWHNKTEVNKLIGQDFSVLRVGPQGQDIPTKIGAFSKLTEEMATMVYESKSQTAAERARKAADEHELISSNLFTITRSQFQLINRTKKDFYKLPLFAVLFIIFEETMPLLCYVIPEITPSTCVLPALLPRLWNSSTAAVLCQMKQDRYSRPDDREQGAMMTAYSMPLDEVLALCRVLRLTSRFIPNALYPESYVRRQLHQYYNYLQVDNYYLAGLNGNGGVFDLSGEELMIACLERNLINDVKPLQKLQQIVDPVERESALREAYIPLRLQLAKFIIDFQTFNMGYLGMESEQIQAEQLNHLLPEGPKKE
ncbi:hypothetical protein DICA3_E21792 [Diutina catenulata]